jgi:DNA-directed RNA polymerase II subunit RPB1
LNVSATKPYNADFDGDEMNMHVPQSIAAATELRMIATIQRQIISPRTCSPIISLFQDTLTGVFRISNPDVVIPEHIVMNMVARMKRPLSSFKRLNQPFSGPDVISHAFPLMNVNSKVKVENGKLTKGLLNDGAFKSASKGLIHILYSDYGHARCGEFINAIQNIVTKYNLYSGFSTGPSDLILPSDAHKNVQQAIQEGKKQVATLLKTVHSGAFLNTSGRTDGEELELQIANILSQINATITGIVASSLPKSNRMIQMSNEGANSKGNVKVNLAQMTSSLGQIIVDGKRIQPTMDNRTLPHFTKFDDGPQARGFVQNSFIEGIRPAEFFFHAMGGREGLIDTAVKTSDTGYTQRRLVKVMEDVHVAQDTTVRDINDAIIQFSYGEDGIDTVYIEEQECTLATMTMEQVYSMFAATLEEYKSMITNPVAENPPDLVEQLLQDRRILVSHVFRYSHSDTIKAPVHIQRLLEKYKNQYAVKTDLTPQYVVDKLTQLMSETYIIHNKLFHILLRFYLAPRRCIMEYRLSQGLFDELIEEIRYKYIKSMVHTGEMVGPLAAQSIGEPTTQLTLNTFHTAGTTKANATQGFPRIKELLDVSRNPKNPSNVIYLVPSKSGSEDACHSIMKHIQKTTLRDITKSVRIYYDPNPVSPNTLVREDAEMLKIYQDFSVGQGQSCVSPWIMRLELDKMEMAARNVIDMTQIQMKITNNRILKVFDCVHTDSNVGKLIVRVTFSNDVVKNALSLRFIEEKLLDTVLTGVDGIGRVFRREIKSELMYDERVGGYTPQKQFVLDSEGANLFDLFMFPDVDPTRTFSNDIYEILNVFGIETARMALYEEIMEVFTGTPINYHHGCLLVDVMTYHGYFISINRFGMGKTDNGVLAKCSFEMTSKVLFDAAVSGEFDTMRGITANIMFGQKPPCGTGFVDILVDETRLPEGADETVDTTEVDLAHANALVEEENKKDDAQGHCRMDAIEMSW